MAGSKFFNIRKNAKKVIKKEEELPKTVEVTPEKAVEAPMLAEEELKTLLDGLNEEPKPVEIEKVVNTVINEVIRSEELQDEVIFTAYGIYYDERKKKYVKIELDYSPISLYSKVRSVEDWADSGPTALSKLNKILSLRLLKREEKI